MKKRRRIISVMFAVVMLLALTMCSVSALSTYIRGDADRSDNVDAIDVTYILRKLSNIPVPNTFFQRAADVNGDGELEVIDATLIQRYNVNISNPYKIGEIVKYDEYELPVV